MLDTSSRFKSIILDRGSNAGIQVNDAVVNANGLIGRVVLTTKDMVKVQLVTDNNSSVGVLLERTRRQGVLRGDGAGGAQLYDIPSLADVRPGDNVLTAGIDGIYPKGIPVGVITKAEKGQDLFKMIAVKPAVDRFTETGAAFADGSTGEFDAAVLATGYRPALGDFLAVPDVLDGDGYPRDWSGGGACPNLFFVGYTQPATGLLREIAIEAAAVAAAITGA